MRGGSEEEACGLLDGILQGEGLEPDNLTTVVDDLVHGDLLAPPGLSGEPLTPHTYLIPVNDFSKRVSEKVFSSFSSRPSWSIVAYRQTSLQGLARLLFSVAVQIVLHGP